MENFANIIRLYSDCTQQCAEGLAINVDDHCIEVNNTTYLKAVKAPEESADQHALMNRSARSIDPPAYERYMHSLNRLPPLAGQPEEEIMYVKSTVLLVFL